MTARPDLRPAPDLTFASDNVGPAAPQVMEAVMAANAAPAMPYGADPFTERAVALVREGLGAPEASVHLVATGSAANALALAALARPWEAIFCHETAHVEMDEAGAPEFFSGGAKLRRVPGAEGKMTPDALAAALEEIAPGDVHSVQRGPVTLTQLTEAGTAYTLDELDALTAVARGAGLPVHLDGARLANALVGLDVAPARMVEGLDAVSLGGTKNGCLGVEAVVILDPARAWEVSLRRKRAGHLWSKHRFLGAQMAAYLEDGLWLDLARRANARMAELVAGLRAHPDAALVAEPAGNLAFVELPKAAHDRARTAGARYYLQGDGPGVAPDTPLRARVVCDWSKRPEDVEALLDLWRG